MFTYISFFLCQISVVLPKVDFCTQDTLIAQWWSIPPYIYKTKNGKIEGIFKEVLDTIVSYCCNGHTNITYAEQPMNDSEVVKDHIGENGTVISFPVYGEMKDITFQNYPFMPVVEAPGVVFIMTPEDSADAAQAVMGAVFQGWPVLVLTLVMAMLSGIIIWALVRTCLPNHLAHAQKSHKPCSRLADKTLKCIIITTKLKKIYMKEPRRFHGHC